MNEQQFKARTKAFALAVIQLVDGLPRVMTAQVIGKQLVRAATSVGANYRSACRARSTADMIAKLAIVEEEADECVYWLELLGDAKLVEYAKLEALISESNQLVAMTVSSIRTLRGRIPPRV